MYQLNPNWGYPRGPRGKTSLESAASQKAAANRFALDPVDAEAMNLHLGSYAPPSAVLVNADSFMQLWNGVSYAWTNPWMGRNVRLLDKRHASLMANGAELLRAALNLDGASTASLALPTPARTAPALAYTGSSTRSTAVAGFGLVTAGAVLVRLAERRSAQQQ